MRLDPDRVSTREEFWKFSWEEIGSKDLPAMIDHILGRTGKSRIHYIGHSQGTTAFFAMGTLRPEYNDKITSMHAFAPVAYMEHNENILFKTLGPHANNIEVHFLLLLLSSCPPRLCTGGHSFTHIDIFIQKYHSVLCK